MEILSNKNNLTLVNLLNGHSELLNEQNTDRFEKLNIPIYFFKLCLILPLLLLMAIQIIFSDSVEKSSVVVTFLLLFSILSFIMNYIVKKLIQKQLLARGFVNSEIDVNQTGQHEFKIITASQILLIGLFSAIISLDGIKNFDHKFMIINFTFGLLLFLLYIDDRNRKYRFELALKRHSKDLETNIDGTFYIIKILSSRIPIMYFHKSIMNTTIVISTEMLNRFVVNNNFEFFVQSLNIHSHLYHFRNNKMNKMFYILKMVLLPILIPFTFYLMFPNTNSTLLLTILGLFTLYASWFTIGTFQRKLNIQEIYERTINVIDNMLDSTENRASPHQLIQTTEKLSFDPNYKIFTTGSIISRYFATLENSIYVEFYDKLNKEFSE